MEPGQLIQLAVGVIFFIFWLLGQIKSGEGAATAVATVAPPALPRRSVRRNRPAAPNAAPLVESEGPVVVARKRLDASHLQVTRPAVARVRGEFRGTGALRRAIIAREVLGQPLALRAPRL